MFNNPGSCYGLTSQIIDYTSKAQKLLLLSQFAQNETTGNDSVAPTSSPCIPRYRTEWLTVKLPENKLHAPPLTHTALSCHRAIYVRTDAVVALEPKRNCLAPASRAPRGHSTATTFSTTTTHASSSSLSFLPWQARKERCLENRSPSIPANVLMVLCRDHLILLGISLKAIDCHS